MTASDGVLLVIVGGLTAYVLLAGADFGGGVWDLFARGRLADRQRRLIAASLGPVWEANHVWLILALVATFSGFPRAFGEISRSLELPLAVALAGIVLRGAAYVYRAYGDGAAGPDPLWNRVFAVASTVTPFMLGVAGAALASGAARTDDATAPLRSGFCLAAGGLAVALTAFLAAVYLCRDAAAEEDLAEGFRRRALGAAAVTGACALALIPLLHRDAPQVAARLTGRALPLVALSAVGGVAGLVLLWRRRYVAARICAGLAVGSVVWGWAAAQYPYLLIGGSRLSVAAAAAPAANQRVLLGVLLGGLVLTAPGLVVLFHVFSRPEPA